MEAADPGQALSLLFDIYETHGSQFSLLLGESGDPRFARMFKDALLPSFEELRGAPGSERALLVFEFGISGLIAAFSRWSSSEHRIPMEEFAAVMHNIIEGGVLPALREAD